MSSPAMETDPVNRARSDEYEVVSGHICVDS